MLKVKNEQKISLLQQFSSIYWNNKLKRFITIYGSQVRIIDTLLIQNTQKDQTKSSQKQQQFLFLQDQQIIQKFEVSKCEEYFILTSKNNLYVCKFNKLEILYKLQKSQIVGEITHTQLSVKGLGKQQHPNFLAILTVNKILYLIDLERNLRKILKDITTLCFDTKIDKYLYCFKQKELFRYSIQRKVNELTETNKKIVFDTELFKNFTPEHIVRNHSKYVILGKQKKSLDKNIYTMKLMIFLDNDKFEQSFSNRILSPLRNESSLRITYFDEKILIVICENPNQISVFYKNKSIFDKKLQENEIVKNNLVFAEYEKLDVLQSLTIQIFIKNYLIKVTMNCENQSDNELQALPVLKKQITFCSEKPRFSYEEFGPHLQSYIQNRKQQNFEQQINSIINNLINEYENISNFQEQWNQIDKMKEQQFQKWQQKPKNIKISEKYLEKILSYERLKPRRSPFQMINKNKPIPPKNQKQKKILDLQNKIQSLEAKLKHIQGEEPQSSKITDFHSMLRTFNNNQEEQEEIYFTIRSHKKELRSSNFQNVSKIKNNQQNKQLKTDFIPKIPYITQHHITDFHTTIKLMPF